MEKFPTKFSFLRETGEIDWVAVKKPGSSRYVKIYNKADFVNSGISLEQILDSIKSKDHA
jgi:hypothetical protein